MACNKVSIIVPVYNAEKYLNDCINSILNQTYRNIEVILVNDGSTDNSGKICDEYAKKDRRLKVIHQKNFGVSVARNVGIDVATSEYIQFVDSDDYIESNMTEKLISSINNNTQLIICGYKSIQMDEDDIIVMNYTSPIVGTYRKNEFMFSFGELFKKNFINSPCNKLYVSNNIKKHNLHFIENLDMGEDLLFNLEYINTCDNITIIEDSLYNYLNFNSNSLTSGFKKDFFENQQMLFVKVREFLLKNNCYTQENKVFVETSYTNSIVGCLGNLFHFNSNLTPKAKKEYIIKIVYDEYVIKSTPYFKRESIQKRFVGFLIKHESAMGIYCFYKLKMFLKKSMKPLFMLLKRINSK